MRVSSTCRSILADLSRVVVVPQPVDTLVVAFLADVAETDVEEAVSALRVTSLAVACIFSSNAAQISSTDSIKFNQTQKINKTTTKIVFQG